MSKNKVKYYSYEDIKKANAVCRVKIVRRSYGKDYYELMKIIHNQQLKDKQSVYHENYHYDVLLHLKPII